MGIFRKNKAANLVVIEAADFDDDMAWLGEGSTYYWVRSDIGQICKSQWNSAVHHHWFRLSIGNLFRTKKQAEQAIVRQKQWVKDNKLGGKNDII